MRTHEIELNGETVSLRLNGNALFKIYGKFGDQGNILDPIAKDGPEGYDNLIFFMVALAEEGELYRRVMKKDPRPVRTEKWFRTVIMPMDVGRCKKAVTQAVRLGFLRTEEGENRDPFSQSTNVKMEAD